MMLAIYRRTLKDQLRVRTYIFLAFLVIASFAISLGLPAIIEAESSWDDPEPGELTEFEKLDGADLFAVFLEMPLLSGQAILVLFALLMGASTFSKEWADKTGFLLFSKPVPRWKIVVAKVLGAYTWILVGVALTGFGLLLGAAISGVDNAASGALFVGLLWLGFSMLPFVGIPAFIGSMVRRPIPSVVVSVFAVLIAAPLVAQSGFFLAMQNDDFRAEGLYDPDADDDVYPMDACRDELRWPSVDGMEEADSEKELDDAYAAEVALLAEWEECREDDVGDVDAYYESRGAPRERFHYEDQWCNVEVTYEAWDGQGHEPVYNRTYPEREECWNMWDDYNEEERERRDVFVQKFERPLIDAPRYLSPSSVVASWERLAGWSDDESPELIQFMVGDAQAELASAFIYGDNGVGATATPASMVGAILGVVFNSVLWPALTVLGLERRDLA